MVSAYLSYFLTNNDQPCHMEYNAMYVNDILAIILPTITKYRIEIQNLSKWPVVKEV